MIRLSRYSPIGSSLLLLTLPIWQIAAQQPVENGVEATCDTVSGDAAREEDICIGFKFSDGMTHVSAGVATASEFNFEGRLWRLADGVRLAFGTTEILADNALLRFENGELVLGELNGDPVEMSDYIAERDVAVKGTADTISYDRDAGTVQLNGQSTLVVGDNEYMGRDWIYNFNDKKYDAVSVEFRLARPEESDDAQGLTTAP